MADAEAKLSSADTSDIEGDTFEDAPDTSSRAFSQRSPKSDRSRPSSASGGTPSSAISTPRSSRVLKNTNGSIEEEPPASPAASTKNENKDCRSVSLTPQNSQRDSNALSIGVGGDAASDREEPEVSPEEKSDETQTTARGPARNKGISGTFTWGQKAAKPPEPKTTPASSTKKSSSGFSWFSRKPSTNIDTATLPPSKPLSMRERRDTMTSVASIHSNPDLMVKRLDETNDPDDSKAAEKQRNSLRDRFKMLRTREEAGTENIESQETFSPSASGGALAGLIGRSSTLGMGIGSPTSISDEKEDGLVVTSPIQSPEAISPGPATPLPNTNLAPGTAAGMAAGPSAMKDPQDPVDWDLWQAVVYEGPAAVAKTSAADLSRAIASGIPSAIRGVVWQVLAQSKNEELEKVYKELVVRGTDKDRDMTASLQGHAPSQSLANGNLQEKQSITSSASSIKSDHSTPATPAINGLTSPPPPMKEDSESMAKLQFAMIAERKKKAQEDKSAIQKLEKAIRRDLGSRTSYSKYAVAAGLQDGLFGVCKAYALFDESVGYAQGMNFLVMPLLFNMPEEEAFCLLVRLMNQYHLREMFIKDMPGLHLHLYQFERLLEDLEPALYCHLHRKNVSPKLYATQWFLTLFAYRFPLQLVLRIYDLILSEGLEGAILKFGIVLMQKNAEKLLSMSDMSHLTNYLKDRLFDCYIDQAPSNNSILESGFFGSSAGADKEVYRADILVQDACAVRVTPEMLKAYTTEWEEKERTEKERETELESLRSTNAALTLKVRSLEERTETSDAEHVQMASELVRTKVENQELLDNVESLKGQTDELKVMVDKQTEEVEQRLKGEMERIMERNSEVQNQNRGLEEQMAEMEKVLVETKMQFAELNSEHESLKQKWTDLRKALDS